MCYCGFKCDASSFFVQADELENSKPQYCVPLDVVPNDYTDFFIEIGLVTQAEADKRKEEQKLLREETERREFLLKNELQKMEAKKHNQEQSDSERDQYNCVDMSRFLKEFSESDGE